MSPLTDAEIREDGERRYFYRRLEQRAALPIDWTDAEVRAFVVSGIQPERVRQAGEEQWARGEEEARQAQERQERSRGGVVELRNGGVAWHGEKMPPRAVKLIRRYFARRSMIVRRPQPRQRERRPQSRVARATASGTDPPEPRDDDPDLTPLQRGHLLLLEALVVASRGGPRTFATFLDLAATRIAAEVACLTDWEQRP